MFRYAGKPTVAGKTASNINIYYALRRRFFFAVENEGHLDKETFQRRSKYIQGTTSNGTGPARPFVAADGPGGWQNTPRFTYIILWPHPASPIPWKRGQTCARDFGRVSQIISQMLPRQFDILLTAEKPRTNVDLESLESPNRRFVTRCVYCRNLFTVIFDVWLVTKKKK